MKHQFYFKKVPHLSVLDPLIISWRKTLTAPQDGMWETITNHAVHFEIRHNNETIGYAVVNDQNQLLQLFIEEDWQQLAGNAFEELIKEQQISEALVGTNNPVFHNILQLAQKATAVHTLLFTDVAVVATQSITTPIRLAWQEDLATLVDFYHDSTGAPSEWLTHYLSDLISKGELFFLADVTGIMGACEVRMSDTNPKVADIGMVVGNSHRKKGLGTYLLGKAKEFTYDLDRVPICSCEVGNEGSQKAILKNGFKSFHQMLKVAF